MKKHKDMIKGFYRTSKFWYADPKEEVSIMFGMYHPEGGTTGEMSVTWILLFNKLVPKLECFDDGWSALSLFTDLIKKMAHVDSDNITEKEFVEMLLSCGFKDLTHYKKRS